MNYQRIVSLLPSATEIVCALGAGSRLVGRSHECDFPVEMTSLPVCTETALSVAATSREIDAQIKHHRSSALALFRINTRLLQELKPDLILTQAQCDVCALSQADVAQALGGWMSPVPQVLSLTPHRMADVWEDIRRVAVALEIAESGKPLLRTLKNRCVDVIQKACLLSRPTVACLEWLAPLMGAGNWIPELVELAGGKNLLGQAGQHTGSLDWAELRRANPDVIVALPCGFDLARTRKEWSAMRAGNPGWAELKAVQTGRVYACDGSGFFNRPGPRLVESLEIMAELLHPAKYRFGQEGRGWQKLG